MGQYERHFSCVLMFEKSLLKNKKYEKIKINK